MSFKQVFDKNMNKELTEDHMDPPPPIDIEMQQGPPPVHHFESYPQPIPRSGINVPTPLFALFIVVFLFESGIIFVYTLVALWNTLPGPMPYAMGPPAHNCPTVQPMLVTPEGWGPSAGTTVTATATQTIDHSTTITLTTSITPSTTPSTTSSATTSLKSTASPTSDDTDTESALEGILGAALADKEDPTSSSSASSSTSSFSSSSSSATSASIVTVTAPAPTTTVLSTAPAKLPGMTTLTLLSTTEAPIQQTFTSTAVVTASV